MNEFLIQNTSKEMEKKKHIPGIYIDENYLDKDNILKSN